MIFPKHPRRLEFEGYSHVISGAEDNSTLSCLSVGDPSEATGFNSLMYVPASIPVSTATSYSHASVANSGGDGDRGSLFDISDSAADSGGGNGSYPDLSDDEEYHSHDKND